MARHRKSPFSTSSGALYDAEFDNDEVSKRLDEIAEILALGLMRLRARKSSGKLPTGPDFLLGPLALQSGAIARLEGESK